VENKIDASIIDPNEELVLYAVRSQQGQYFRAKGYEGYGSSWVPTLQDAKIYGKIGPAKRQATFWGSHYPKFGTPDVIKITLASLEVIDQKARVDKFKIKKAQEEAREKERRAKDKIKRAQADIAKAKRDMEAAKKEIEKIGSDMSNPIVHSHNTLFNPEGFNRLKNGFNC
jgi:hypothetical protein